jgi:DNA-binding GntR family transcriptional regulator
MAISLKARAYEYLRSKLLNGDLGVGARLSEVALAKEIGISRTPVREAINQLHSEGLLELIPRFGAFVKMLDRRELEELLDLRIALESFTALQVAKIVTDSQLAELQRFCDQMRDIARQARKAKLTDLEDAMERQWVLADANFHVTLLGIAGNRRIMKIIADSRILTQLFAFRRTNPTAPLLTHLSRTYRGHAEIFAALRRHDPKAASHWMTWHLTDGKRHALNRYEWLLRTGADPNTEARSESLRRVIEQLEKYSASGTT